MSFVLIPRGKQMCVCAALSGEGDTRVQPGSVAGNNSATPAADKGVYTVTSPLDCKATLQTSSCLHAWHGTNMLPAWCEIGYGLSW